ncbi:G patch domain-containing protein 1 -like protein [Ceratocystis lukuohia]|uniref:G patch domain-containing protein 1 -like protein n=1 Tax=Ceratocystis lukuohia TaxID=2019550 RepID=A0ABR4MTX4_9PEZI
MSSKRTWSTYDCESSDAPFAVFGSPIPKSKKDRGAFIPLHLQEACDDKGRRRFHGAFTGGWSAGYFNTVGSKEGWTPSAFLSSRTSRAEAANIQAQKPTQKPEDFMDEEDMENVLASTHLQIADGSGAEIKYGGGSLASSPLELLLMGQTSHETTGYRLLRKMDWKPGQGIGPKIRRPARLYMDGDAGHSELTSAKEYMFAPDDVKVIVADHKHIRLGLGYDNNALGTQEGLINRNGQDEDDRPYRFQNRIPLAKSASSSKFIEKTAPLVGVSLDGDDDGDEDDDLGPRINYNKTRPVKSIKKGKKKPNFVALAKPNAKRDPITLVTNTPVHRAAALGEKQLPSQSIFDFVTPEARARLAMVTGKSDLPAAGGKPVPSAAMSVEDAYTTSPSLDRESALAALMRANTAGGPYHNNESKLQRYILYLKFQAKQINVPDISWGLSLAELRLELAEFYNCARIFKPMTGFMASRFAPSSGSQSQSLPDVVPVPKHEDSAAEAAKLGLYGALTRSVKEFVPVQLLFKRFNIPAQSSHTVTSPKPTYVNEPGVLGDSSLGTSKDSCNDTKSQTPQQQQQQQQPEASRTLSRPPDDVFLSIFEDQDE